MGSSVEYEAEDVYVPDLTPCLGEDENPFYWREQLRNMQSELVREPRDIGSSEADRVCPFGAFCQCPAESSVPMADEDGNGSQEVPNNAYEEDADVQLKMG
ncbi:hypothetical protein PIB30_048143 [Stylosanthes scabra]|uniref:Uncharacterized protein n=1 Tax=Stylosanthes scabra TaxID=79078 RepID=A0ABU6THA9_9FABA|nr:hypothetical protein [Stylosanthes scabra]